MEVISIERSTYEELLTSFNSFVTKMKEMANRGKDKGLGDWLDNQDVCQMLNISPRTLLTLRDNGTLAYSQINRKVYYKPEFGISDSRFSCYARFPTGAYYICPPNNMDGKMQNCKVQPQIRNL